MSTSPQTVRRWSSERKSQLVLKLLRGGDAAQLAREHGLSQAELYAWRDRFLEGGRTALKERRRREDGGQARLISTLERKVGQLTMENEILKKTAHRTNHR